MRAAVLVLLGGLAAAGCQFDAGGEVEDGNRGIAPTRRPRLADGFETGLLPWSGTLTERGDTVEPSTEFVHSGAQSLRCRTDRSEPGQAAVYLDTKPGVPDLYVRGHFLFAQGFSVQGNITLLSVVNVSAEGKRKAIADVLLRSVRGDELALEIAVSGTRRAQRRTMSLPLGEWQRFDLHVAASSARGTIKLDVDGVTQTEILQTDLGDLPIERVEIGNVWSAPGGRQNTIFVNDVVISERAID